MMLKVSSIISRDIMTTRRNTLSETFIMCTEKKREYWSQYYKRYFVVEKVKLVSDSLTARYFN
jgi:hypothetical protein